MAWPYITTLEWVLYRDLMISKSYDDEILAGGDPTSVSRISLMPSFEDNDLLRIPFFSSLRQAEAAILQKAGSGELSVHGTPLLTPSQQCIPSREFHNASITEEIVPPNKVEHRLLPDKRRLDQWSDLLFDPDQVKAIWPSVESNPINAGRKTGTYEGSKTSQETQNQKKAGRKPSQTGDFIYSCLNASWNCEGEDWFRGKTKRKIFDYVDSFLTDRHVVHKSRTTIHTYIDIWFEANIDALKSVNKPWSLKKLKKLAHPVI